MSINEYVINVRDRKILDIGAFETDVYCVTATYISEAVGRNFKELNKDSASIIDVLFEMVDHFIRCSNHPESIPEVLRA